MARFRTAAEQRYHRLFKRIEAICTVALAIDEDAWARAVYERWLKWATATFPDV
jgi:hypothetical protein